MSAFLPLHDPDRATRDEALRTARLAYGYNYTHVSPLAMLDAVSFRDEFSVDWLTQIAENVTVVFENNSFVEIDAEINIPEHGLSGILERLETDAEAALVGLKQVVSDALRLNVKLSAAPVSAKSIDEFAGLFRTIGLPPVSKTYANDDAFAGMRVIGPNPVMIRRLTERDARFPFSDSDFRAVLPNDSFDAALAEGRAYLADYSVLDGIDCSSFPHRQKYVYAPLALFVVNKATKRLTPVAIQCKQQPGPENPIFTPHDGYNWLIAKTIVEIADGNIHEPSTHLGRTHLLMEPFVVSTFRQLAPNHPLAVLLAPHFQGTLAINEAA